MGGIFLWGICLVWACEGAAEGSGHSFRSRIISETNNFNRSPVISETGVAAWLAVHTDREQKGPPRLDVMCWADGERINLRDRGAGGACDRPRVWRDEVVFVSRVLPGGAEKGEGEGSHATGIGLQATAVPLTEKQKEMEKTVPTLFHNTHALYDATLTNEVVEAGQSEGGEVAEGEGVGRQDMLWDGTDIYVYSRGKEGVRVLTAGDHSVSFPCLADGGAAWQCSRIWPYGYDIVAWDRAKDTLRLVSTNFFYLLAPVLQGEELVFQGWDGHDYEIYLYDLREGGLTQLTDNQFDDVDPTLWSNQVAWVAYPATTSEIFHWDGGEIRKISTDSKENLNPRIWNGQVVWQGFDGEDIELYFFDGVRTLKLTSNTWDDIQPCFRDNLITWMSYVDGWDSEIMVMDIRDHVAVTLTENATEDLGPETAGGKVVWQSNELGHSVIYLAE